VRADRAASVADAEKSPRPARRPPRGSMPH